MKKNTKIAVILAAVLAVLVAVALILSGVFSADTEKGDKTVLFTVVHADGSEKEFTLKTDAQYLADALLEQKLITEAEYKSGFYLTVDGETTDYNSNQSWWCITKDGEMTSVGMNEQPIKDGDSFEATYTIG